MIFLATLLYTLITFYTNTTFLMCNKIKTDQSELYTKEYINKHKWNLKKYKNYM
jgi:hypothetical protein